MADDTPATPWRKVYATPMQRAADAYAMRVRGATWATIAEACGFSNPQNAMRAIRNYVGKLPQPQMTELRSMWRDRLEYLWPLAARDVEDGRPGATRAAVAVAQRAAAMDGLDAPQRVTVTPGEADLDRIVDEILRRSGRDLPEDAEVIDLEILPMPDADEDDPAEQ